MKAYLLRRLLSTPPLLLVIAALVFGATRWLPGDPIQIMMGEKATPEAREAAIRRYGLDRPIPEQFGRYLKDLLTRGDLGDSIILRPGEPVTAALARHLPPTIELACAAMLIATVAGIALGVAAAVRRGSWIDTAGMCVSVLGVSIPIFWLGLLLILAFGGLLPTGGNLGIALTIPRPTGFVLIDTLLAGEGFADALRHLMLPALTLATVPLSITARVTRASMLEVLGSDYVRTARAKGVAPETVVMRHAFRNALVPISTVLGLELAGLLGGAVLTETVFAWPGLGRWIVDASIARDYPAINAGVLVLAVIFVIANLAVDLLYAAVDPRIRYGR
jgi:ABC-type dipeptide/oligopeptide/nickel transport system permease component